MSNLNFELRSDLAKTFQKYSLTFYEMHHSNQLMSIESSIPAQQQMQLV